MDYGEKIEAAVNCFIVDENFTIEPKCIIVHKEDLNSWILKLESRMPGFKVDKNNLRYRGVLLFGTDNIEEGQVRVF